MGRSCYSTCLIVWTLPLTGLDASLAISWTAPSCTWLRVEGSTYCSFKNVVTEHNPVNMLPAQHQWPTGEVIHQWLTVSVKWCSAEKPWALALKRADECDKRAQGDTWPPNSPGINLVEHPWESQKFNPWRPQWDLIVADPSKHRQMTSASVLWCLAPGLW